MSTKRNRKLQAQAQSLRNYAETSAAPPPQQAGLSLPPPGSGAGSTQPRPGPGPRGQLSKHPSPGGQLSSHPSPGNQMTPGPHPGISVHPGGEEVPFVPNNPQMRLLYPDLFGEPGSIVNSPHCYLPNNDPNAMPTVDRGRPTSAYEKSVRLGIQPQPNALGFLAPGDSASGSTQFRRTQLFARMDDPVTSTVSAVVFNQSIGLATQRSSDNRPRIWHVSVFGIGRYRFNAITPQSPLPEADIIGDGFVGASGPLLTSSPLPYIPRIMNFKARAMIHDESGQRFYDFDVLGTRSFDVFAFAVTVFLLVPAGTYEVNPQNPDGNPPSLGLVQDAIVGARVMPVSFESALRRNQRTETISVTPTVNAADTAVIPIPPGARNVTIINHGRVPASAAYNIDFDVGAPAGSGVTSDLGVIILNPVTFRTDTPIPIPNATFIRFQAQIGAAATSFSLVYDIDP